MAFLSRNSTFRTAPMLLRPPARSLLHHAHLHRASTPFTLAEMLANFKKRFITKKAVLGVIREQITPSRTRIYFFVRPESLRMSNQMESEDDIPAIAVDAAKRVMAKLAAITDAEMRLKGKTSKARFHGAVNAGVFTTRDVIHGEVVQGFVIGLQFGTEEITEETNRQMQEEHSRFYRECIDGKI